MRYTPLSPELYEYLVKHGHNDDPVLAALAAETAEKLGPFALMQIASEQGTLMSILARAIRICAASEISRTTSEVSGASGSLFSRANAERRQLVTTNAMIVETYSLLPAQSRGGLREKSPQRQ